MKPLITILVFAFCFGVFTPVHGQTKGAGAKKVKRSKKQRDKKSYSKEIQSDVKLEYDLDCTLKLDRARALFEKGLLDKIPPLLADCAHNKSLPSTTRQAILKLLAETHLFLNQESKAADYYWAILKIDPFHQTRPNIDHPELVHLSNKFKTFSPFSFGGKGGLNRTIVNTKTQFINEDSVSTQQDNFTNKWHALAGVFCTYRPGGRRLEFMLEGLFSKFEYEYEGTMAYRIEEGNGTLFYTETENVWQFPFSIKYVTGQSRIKPYFYAGAAAFFISKARFDDIRLSTLKNGNFSQNQTSGFSILDNEPAQLRKHISYTAHLGLGARYQFKRFYFFADARYNRMLTNVVKTANRRSDTRLNNDFWYVDNDFGFDSVAISLGMGYSIFRSIRAE